MFRHLLVARGERVELVIVNWTPMPDAMHLHGHGHGHEFQVVEIDGTCTATGQGT